ncbi:hypothetical protein SAMN06269117_1382 [Balnearium lithotrophicum]|uniref:TPR repeat n=2 Tax=Balnearium lithotrophicum TaxID=223788 RepID=A0A521EE45_9BACT|nr:hypothetical protein SAMN06269117_1382 [Balnearium lithotrophicum]
MVILLLAIFSLFFSSCIPMEMDKCLSGKIENVNKLIEESKEYSRRGFPEGYFCYGLAELKSKNYEEAIPPLESAYRKKIKRAAFYLGKAYKSIGNRKLASYWFLKALENGFITEDFFLVTSYISKEQLNELESLAKKHPLIYLYLGNYFYRNGIYDAALYYYGIATRYGFEKAKIMFGLTLYKLGNFKGALNVLYSYYKESESRKGAYLIASLIEKHADSLNNCFVLTSKTPEELIQKLARSFKKREVLYKQSAKFYFLAKSRKDYKRVLKKASLVSLKGRNKGKLFLKGKFKSYFELISNCKEGSPVAEILLSKKRGEEWYRALIDFYSSIGFDVVR